MIYICCSWCFQDVQIKLSTSHHLTFCNANVLLLNTRFTLTCTNRMVTNVNIYNVQCQIHAAIKRNAGEN